MQTESERQICVEKIDKSSWWAEQSEPDARIKVNTMLAFPNFFLKKSSHNIPYELTNQQTCQISFEISQ